MPARSHTAPVGRTRLPQFCEPLEARRLLATFTATDLAEILTVTSPTSTSVRITSTRAPFLYEVNGLSNLTINALGGNDVINLNEVDPAIPITINAGDGNDAIIVGGGDLDTDIDGNVTVNGGFGDDTLTIADQNDGAGADAFVFSGGLINKNNRLVAYGSVEDVSVLGSDEPTVYTLNAKSPATRLAITGGDAGDTFRLGGGNLNANLLGEGITLTGGLGNDVVRYDDSAAPARTDVAFASLSDGRFIRNGIAGAASVTVDTFGFEHAEIHTGDLDTQWYLFDNPTTLRFVGGPADDWVIFNEGDLDGILGATVSGGAGFDQLIVRDDFDAGNDAYLVTAGGITKTTPSAFGGITVSGGTGDRFEYTELDANELDNLVHVTGTFSDLVIAGRQGFDVINVDHHDPAHAVTIIPGDQGDDDVNVNADQIGTANVTIRDQTLRRLRVFEGGTATFAPNFAGRPTALGALVLGGTLDVNIPVVFLDASVFTADFVRARLENGFAGGAWTGTTTPQMTSSVAQASGVADAIGYAFAGDVGITDYAGLAVGAGDLLIGRFLLGDADFDGQVTLADFGRLRAGFGFGTFWSSGDFDYDGVTGLADFGLLRATFGTSLAAAGSLFGDDE